MGRKKIQMVGYVAGSWGVGLGSGSMTHLRVGNWQPRQEGPRKTERARESQGCTLYHLSMLGGKKRLWRVKTKNERAQKDRRKIRVSRVRGKGFKERSPQKPQQAHPEHL